MLAVGLELILGAYKDFLELIPYAGIPCLALIQG